MNNRRLKRLECQIQKEVSSIIIDRLKDPGVGFITVTSVDLSIDFKYAKVYVSILGDEKEKKVTMKILEKATRFVRRELGKRIRVRFLPELQFKFDSGVEYATYIDSLLKKINSETGKKTNVPDN